MLRVQPPAREQNGVAASASDMRDALMATGRVALYGILFGTDKADIAPESGAAFTEIANSMKSQQEPKLHVVGHSDSQDTTTSTPNIAQPKPKAI